MTLNRAHRVVLRRKEGAVRETASSTREARVTSATGLEQIKLSRPMQWAPRKERNWGLCTSVTLIRAGTRYLCTVVE
jgi:hypothetical protein